MVTFPSTLLGLSKSKYVAQGSLTISQDMGTSLSIKWTSQPLAHTLYSSHVSHAMTRARARTENAAILLEAHLRPRPPPGPFCFLRKYTQSL